MKIKLIIIVLVLVLCTQVRSESTIVVIGTNDIHGKAFPTVLSREDTG